MIKKIIPVIIGVAVVISCNTEKSTNLPPVNLTCESDTNPIGIDIPDPALGWQLADTGIGAMQGAYQIIVASSENLLDEQKADAWNSGKIISGASQFVIYSGKPLLPFKTYYWTVRTWDTSKNVSVFAKPTRFETGLMLSKWKASWIKPSENLSNENSILYRKSFTTSKKIQKATVYASGVGAYTIYVNDKRLGDEHLSPGWTTFEKKVQYQVYDATLILNEGENVIGIVVSKFWDELENAKIVSSLQFILQMKIDYTDGSSEWVITDKLWKLHSSPIFESSYKGGEKYNANFEIENWNNTKFDDKKWQTVSEAQNKLQLVRSTIKPIKVYRNMYAKKITSLENKKYVFDFGQELCGWVKLNMKLSKGSKIRIKYISEHSKMGAENYESPTDEYITNGKSSEWEPEFSYHKFRFAEIYGLIEAPDTSKVYAIAAYPALPKIGQFSCANELLNKINDLVERTGLNNLVSMLTGLPDDDSRKGSPVNAQAYASYALYNFNSGKAFEKYTSDLCDLQANNGKLNLGNNGSNSPGWPEAIIVVPWETYLFTGDKRILQNNYKAMKAWHSSQQHESDAQAPPYMHNKEGLGDLFSLDSTPTKPIGSAYYYYASSLMSQISEALGNQDDATAYMELAGFTKDQYNQSYLTYRTSRYWANTQTAHIIPMAVGLTPLSYIQRVIKFIASDIIKNGNHPSTGVLSTQFLLPLLSENGEHELAYKLMNQQTHPSLGYMVKQGSSEIWGSWDKENEALYQLAFASCGEWVYSYLVGIRPDPKVPGFKHSIIDPNPAGDLKWAEASIYTSYGLLKTKWEKTSKGLQVDVVIPTNTTSTLMFQVKSSKKAEIIYGSNSIVKNGKVTDQCPKFIKFRGFNANMAVIDVGSGHYQFITK